MILKEEDTMRKCSDGSKDIQVSFNLSLSLWPLGSYCLFPAFVSLFA